MPALDDARNRLDEAWVNYAARFRLFEDIRIRNHEAETDPEWMVQQKEYFADAELALFEYYQAFDEYQAVVNGNSGNTA